MTDTLTFTPVVSSNLKEVAYANNSLYVRFHNGDLYQYKGVPENYFQGLQDAVSVGSYFNTFIKSSYPCEKMTEVLVNPVIMGVPSALEPSADVKYATSTLDLYDGLLKELRAERTDERSEKNRYLAVAITQLELAMGYYATFVVKPPTF